VSDLSEVVVRKPVISDVPVMARIINGYASEGQMLPVSLHKLYQWTRDFVEVTYHDQVVGCGALRIVWEDLAEIRSLAVAQEWRSKGLGRLIVEHLLNEARVLGLPGVFALTYSPGFFARMGFREVSRESLPHKIWGDCLDCPKFPNCDEVAMTIDLQEEQHEG